MIFLNNYTNILKAKNFLFFKNVSKKLNLFMEKYYINHQRYSPNQVLLVYIFFHTYTECFLNDG